MCVNLSVERRSSLSADGDLVKSYELLWHLAEVVLLQVYILCLVRLFKLDMLSYMFF